MPVGHYDRTRIPRRGRPGFLREILGDLGRDWMSRAACRNLIPADATPEERRRRGAEIDDMFYPVVPHLGHSSGDVIRRYHNKIQRAKAICADCPVTTACEQYRRSFQDENGVWGGRDELDREQRRQLECERRSQPVNGRRKGLQHAR